jgi:GTPase SAR1 family protein
LVYSVNDTNSFENVDYWLSDLDKNADRSKFSIILVGNKIDLPDRKIDKK